jgi:hypothetical protein
MRYVTHQCGGSDSDKQAVAQTQPPNHNPIPRLVRHSPLILYTTNLIDFFKVMELLSLTILETLSW